MAKEPQAASAWAFAVGLSILTLREFSARSDAAAWVEGRSIGAYPEPTRKTNQHATISAKMTFSGGTALIPVLARLGEGDHPADNPERNYDQKA
jgi:hypothetical protein